MEYSEDDSKPFIEWKLNREMALRSHAEHDASAQALFRSTIDYGLEAIRTAALINGGAVIACFALLGTMRGDAQSTLMFKALLGPAFTFAAGAVLAGCASGFAYVAQSLHTDAHHAVKLHWDAPHFQEDKPEKWRLARWGVMFQSWSVVSVIASYVCLIIGLYIGYHRMAG